MNLLNGGAAYTGIVTVLCVIMNMIPFYFIYKGIYNRKKKECKRGYLCAITSVLCTELAMTCVGGIIEQFYIADNMSVNGMIVILQTVLDFILSIVTFLFVTSRRKRNIFAILLTTCTGFIMVNYISYFIMIFGLSVDNLLLYHIVIAVATIIFFSAACTVLKTGEIKEIREKEKKPRKKKKGKVNMENSTTETYSEDSADAEEGELVGE